MGYGLIMPHFNALCDYIAKESILYKKKLDSDIHSIYN